MLNEKEINVIRHYMYRVIKEKVLSSSVHLVFCFLGLQACFVFAGVIQEEIITQTYDVNANRVSLSKVLVLSNRLIGMLVAKMILYWNPSDEESAIPFLQYLLPALSNGISSYCQYEALKYIIFPTQLLAKSFKVIPSLIMGFLLNQGQYSIQDYMTALLISSGTFLFAFSRMNEFDEMKDENILIQSTSMYGVFLLAVYLIADSFTGQWQSRIFCNYKVSPYEMMFGVNFFASIFVLIGCADMIELSQLAIILKTNWRIGGYIAVLAWATSIGQLFIFYIVKQYDPVVLMIMMSIRQLISMILSCSIYGHHLFALAKLGISLVVLGVVVKFWNVKTSVNYSSNKKKQ